MASTIPEALVREIVARTSIAQLVGEYVALKKAGSRLKGLCPFHNEKTPSFSVNEGAGFFHCFGCGESGDAISFLRKHSGLSFVEAVERLAARAGILIVREDDPTARRDRAQIQRERSIQEELRRVCGMADVWFHERLLEAPPGSVVRSYLAERGLTDQTVRDFHLGYAPPAWGALADWMAAQRLPADKAEAAGLVAPRKTGAGYYDRFRNRLIFPILDLAGQAIAFGGRRLPGEEEEAAKYINSPDSPIYTKGDVLFGLAQARKHIRTAGFAVVVEGNIDLLTLHQEGIGNTVAPMGTALTPKQVALLHRFTERVVLLYDGDGAGRKAARAAAPMLIEAAVGGGVAMLPDGEDPDSFVRKRGAATLRELLDRAVPLTDWLIGETVREHGLSAHGQARAAEELAPIIAKVQSSRERDLLIARLASALHLEERRVAAWVQIPGLARREAQGRQAMPKMPLRERKLVEVALWYPDRCLPVIEALDPEVLLLAHDGLRDVLTEAITVFGEAQRLDVARLVAVLDDHPLARWVADVICGDPDVPETGAEAWVRDAIQMLIKDRREERARSLEGEIAAAQRDGDEERLRALFQEKLELRRGLQRASGSAP